MRKAIATSTHDYCIDIANTYAGYSYISVFNSQQLATLINRLLNCFVPLVASQLPHLYLDVQAKNITHKLKNAQLMGVHECLHSQKLHSNFLKQQSILYKFENHTRQRATHVANSPSPLYLFCHSRRQLLCRCM